MGLCGSKDEEVGKNKDEAQVKTGGVELQETKNPALALDDAEKNGKVDLAGLQGGQEGLKKAETVVKQADLKTQVAGESFLSGLGAGKDGLKKAETVVKQADLKTQVAGESVKALAGTNAVDAGMLAGVSLKKADTVVKQASLEDQVEGEKAKPPAHPLAQIIASPTPEEKKKKMDLAGLQGGTNLKKAETVVKQADLKTQVAGESFLSGLEAGKDGLKKAETVVKQADLATQVAGESVKALAGTNAVDAGMLADVSLKKADTVVKVASLKDQVEGEKAKPPANPVAQLIEKKAE